MAIPIIHLGSGYPSSFPTPVPLPVPQLEPDKPALDPLANSTTPSTPQLKRRKSILKKMAIPITWDENPSATFNPDHYRPLTPGSEMDVKMQPHPHKLHKNPPKAKQVHFTPPPSAEGGEMAMDLGMGAPGGEYDYGLPTPEASPAGLEKGKKVKKKPSIISRMLPSRSSQHQHAHQAGLPSPSPGFTDHDFGGHSGDEGGTNGTGTDSWHHHPSYFPEYEPIHPAGHPGCTFIPGVPGVIAPATYFPNYTPIFHPSHPIHSYPGASGALAYALTTPEAEAAAHAQRVGHSVIVHYPDLPSFSDYQQSSKGGQGGTGWQGTKWGVEGWTGFGWAGEKLPDPTGLTFGVPMPRGEVFEVVDGTEGKKGKGKGKNKGSEGDGAGEEGGGGEDAKAGTEDGGAGFEATAAPAAGGGGGKKKGKKK